MFAVLAQPVRALLFTLGGALLAWLGSSVSLWASVAVAVAVFLLGLAVSGIGRRLVGTNDRLAMRLMETRILSVAALTATLGAVGILVAVELAAPEGAAYCFLRRRARRSVISCSAPRSVGL